MPIDHPDFVEPKVAGANTVLDNVIRAVGAGLQVTVGPFDATPFSQLLIIVNNDNGLTSSYQIVWWKDAAGTIAQGTPSTYASTLGAVAYLIVDTQGPFFTFSVSNNTGGSGNWNIQIVAFPNDRARTLLLPPTLADSQNTSIAANGTATDNPSFVIPGRAFLSGLGVPTSWRVDAQVWSGTVWNTLATVQGGANQGAQTDFTVPMNDIRVLVSNLTGSAGLINRALVMPAG